MSSPNNGRAFNSFNFESQEHLNNLVHGRPIKTGFMNNGLSKKQVADHLNRIEVKESKDMSVPEKYLTTLYKTAEECLTKLGQL